MNNFPFNRTGFVGSLTITIIFGWFFFSELNDCSDCVVPGHGVGAVRLNDSYQVLVNKWGQPDALMPGGAIERGIGKFSAHYLSRGISAELVYQNGSYFITIIHLLDASYFTPNLSIEPVLFERFAGKIDDSIGIGSTREEVNGHIGGVFIADEDDNPENDVFNCQRVGLNFVYESNIVKQISLSIRHSDGC